MIPTREQINAYPYFGDTSKTWLRAMRDEIDRLTAANEADGAALLDAQREAAKLRAELAALKPSEDREAAIRAWKARAMAVEDDGDYHPIDVYRVTLGEIRAAVALMRSAGDGKALLRELRAWICGEWSSALAFGSIRRILDGIDEMLAQPAPVEKPTDAKIKEMEERFNANYRSIHPVEQPAAAVPDDTRELVAQLAEHVVTMCDGMDFGVALSEVQAIAAKLRGWA
jgi:hypothetical protein